MEKQLTTPEKRALTMRVKELLEHVRLYGSPKEDTHFVIDKMMAYRIKGIKARPELLVIAKKIDKDMLIF